MSIEELEVVVSRLSPEELTRFSEWFDEFLAEQWDRQIEADVSAGRLDGAGKRADDDFEAGRCTPL
ncbi:MAG TPA: hypothetical protein VEW46_11100 [Pyrinomonadaceae bacterium]|nr:hypothetical protein [Pyrinomonadaceae bacterium]